MNNFWDVGFSDYIAWGLGIGAIIIAIFIFFRQERTNKKLDDLKKGAVYSTLARVYNNISECKTSIEAKIQIVDLTPKIEEKIATAKLLIDGGSEGFNKFVDEITKDFEFLRMNMMMFMLHDDIEKLKHNIKSFSDKTTFDVNFGSPEENLQVWISYGRSANHRIDFIMDQIENELKPFINEPVLTIELPKNEPTVDTEKK